SPRCEPQGLTAGVLSLHPADGVADERGGVLQFELRLDVGTMHVHRLGAEMELLRDVARAFALADELEDLELAVTEFFDGRVGAARAASRQRVEQFRRHALA